MGGVFRNREHQEEKRRLSQLFKQIKTWQFALALIPLAFLTATFLRFDHLKMHSLKEKVMLADQGKTPDHQEITSQEDIDYNLKQSLTELKKYTDSHIVINFIEKNGRNSLVFGSGPFYLENQYNRKATAALAEAEKRLKEVGDQNPNGNIFAKAMEVCKPQAIAHGWAWNSPGYLNCMTSIINSYPSTDQLTTSLTANIPPTSLYRYDFSSPVWAPTLSGFSLLLCVVLFFVILFRFITFLIFRIALIFLK